MIDIFKIDSKIKLGLTKCLCRFLITDYSSSCIIFTFLSPFDGNIDH